MCLTIAMVNAIYTGQVLDQYQAAHRVHQGGTTTFILLYTLVSIVTLSKSV